MSIVKHGSRKQHLQDGALSIFELCMQYSIKLELDWIPRSSNEKADFISLIIDYDDWRVNPQFFHYSDVLWGPHTVDCFASFYNNQLPRISVDFGILGLKLLMLSLFRGKVKFVG